MASDTVPVFFDKCACHPPQFGTLSETECCILPRRVLHKGEDLVDTHLHEPALLVPPD